MRGLPQSGKVAPQIVIEWATASWSMLPLAQEGCRKGDSGSSPSRCPLVLALVGRRRTLGRSSAEIVPSERDQSVGRVGAVISESVHVRGRDRRPDAAWPPCCPGLSMPHPTGRPHVSGDTGGLTPVGAVPPEICSVNQVQQEFASFRNSVATRARDSTVLVRPLANKHYA